MIKMRVTQKSRKIYYVKAVSIADVDAWITFDILPVASALISPHDQLECSLFNYFRRTSHLGKQFFLAAQEGLNCRMIELFAAVVQRFQRRYPLAALHLAIQEQCNNPERGERSDYNAKTNKNQFPSGLDA